jgi:DDE superfamily endonuclease
MPGRVVVAFLDEMGYSRRPEPAPDRTGTAPAPPPATDRAASPNGLRRIIGALNTGTGRVDFLDASIVGRTKVVRFCGQSNDAYPGAERLPVAQDNRSIHTHEDVRAALTRWPRIEPVWQPTDVPWLNPIEELWRWLRQDIAGTAPPGGDWPSPRGRVNQFLGRFAAGSHDPLRYVGLLGKGKLAQALRLPP